MPRVHIKFPHGLGDCVNARGLIVELKSAYPGWDISIGVAHGCQPLFEGICHSTQVDVVPDHDKLIELGWHECMQTFGIGPATKREKCLRDYFSIPASTFEDPEYTIPEGAMSLARNYLDKIMDSRTDHAIREDGRYPTVVCHFNGNTSGGKKDISGEGDVSWILRMIRDDLGCIPIVLDWNEPARVEIPGDVFHPGVAHEVWGVYPHGNAASIAALIEQSCLFIGIDSGPGHVASLTSTPSILVWYGHHPIHYCHPSTNVHHLVEPNIQSRIRGNREDGETWFQRAFKSRVYNSFLVDLRSYAKDVISGIPDGLTQYKGVYVRENMIEQDKVIVEDILVNDSYQFHAIPKRQELFVDIGAHVGCASLKYHQHNPSGKVVAVEVAPENIDTLRQNVADFATVIHGACTYEQGDISLLNAVYEGCASTGGSTVLTREEVVQYEQEGPQRQPAKVEGQQEARSREYFGDHREIRKVTLEEILQIAECPIIDILKLDCEGSEYSILYGTSVIHKIARIVGEYHGGKERFLKMVADRFEGWKLTTGPHQSDINTFSLTNPYLT